MTGLPKPEEMSHAMLIAVLMDLGGSHEMDGSAMETDALGGFDGAFHAVELQPLPDGRIRLAVVPRPAGDPGGIEFR